MRMLTIEASSAESARVLCDALAAFEPELVEDGIVFRVRVSLGRGDADTVKVLDAIERHVTSGAEISARIEMDGMTYTLHAEGGR